jgi:hypothetical protein
LHLKLLEQLCLEHLAENENRRIHMSVIEQACGDTCDTSGACGCGEQASVDRKAPGLAAATGAAAVACTVCCLAPLALPPIILGVGGGFFVVLDHTHAWATDVAIVAVIGAWAWLAWQVMRQNRRVTKSALALMIVASVLTGAASAWPLAEPLVFSALGLAKGAARGG